MEIIVKDIFKWKNVLLPSHRERPFSMFVSFFNAHIFKSIMSLMSLETSYNITNLELLNTIHIAWQFILKDITN